MNVEKEDMLYVLRELNEISDDSLETMELKQKLLDSKEFMKKEFVGVCLATMIEERIEEQQEKKEWDRRQKDLEEE
ncbi:hypothetical protein NPIL_228801 [Nephila pilipes]|uniref:Uncharacterized protein n=1 Tax=Nephila pilipes TaxID=299642 RepID=A0A8X6P1G1_NEPPI|nr:hypothetical protein NPIL_228801 [Nephila pilipes]